MARKKIAVRIEEEFLEILEQIAVGTGRNSSEVIREALKDYIEKMQSKVKCYEIAQRLNLIGKDLKLPSDLSVSRRHFEGFGR